MTVLITGGAGYLGSVLSLVLLEAGHRVRVIDNLMYGGHGLVPCMGHPRFEYQRGDVRDAEARRRAVAGVDAIVHLAAIVGDPACARAPELANAVNGEASAALLEQARAGGVTRFVFASTCSNYGKMADTSVLATEDHDLRPVSLYAETKVGVERLLLAAPRQPIACTVLRFATLFGVSPRMRFDLTVNQFVMEMHVRRRLTVFGEYFWRPYVHVRDAAHAIAAVLAADTDRVAGQVFNVGDSSANFRKIDLVEMIGARVPGATVDFVSVAEDPRDYRVGFDRIREVLGYSTTRSVADGIHEIARALESGAFAAGTSFTNTADAAGVPVAAVEAVCAP